MLVLGFELLAEDVLRVVVGVLLSLLTIYRRELSSNRAYHPNEDDENETLLDNSYHRLMQRDVPDSNNSSASLNDTPTMGLRRRKSSSALPSMTDSSPNNHNREVQQHINHPINNIINEDPTEVLLESAGLVLSGGPFLAMAIAIFDHLVLTTIVSFTSCASYVFYRILMLNNTSTSTTVKRIIPPSPSLQVSEEEALEQLLPESRHDKNSSSHNTAMKQQQNQQHLYSVAWNAATEYFHDITSKLLEGQSDSSSVGGSKTYPNTKESSYPRSKSMGNLQQNLSDEHSRALFHEMLAMQNSGSMDITLLPSDAQIVIFSYLPPKDILAFTCTNRAGRSLLDDGEALIATTSTDHNHDDDGEEEGDDDAYHYHGKNSQTPLLIWKALFHRDFSWVLTDWDIGKEAVVRSMSNYEVDVDAAQQESHRPKAGRVFHHLVSTIIDPEQVKNNHPSIDITSMISQAGYIHPTSSMKEFYFIFKETWLNYTIAGCNSTEKCYIGLHGHVFNITNFVEDHPGSTETLLLQAGRDATIFFESMGHSLVARKLALSMCEVVNGQCVRYDLEGREAKNDLRAESLGSCSLIKPCDSSIAVKRNIPGFLIPKRRSRPRFQGGLHRIRERIRMEEGLQLATAATWANETLGQNGLFGGVQVYHDPFRGWRWWYTDRDFDVVYTKPLS